jgi:hypothetical protein
MVDANVTGTNRGTTSKPKFALKDLWENALFQTTDNRVSAGEDTKVIQWCSKKIMQARIRKAVTHHGYQKIMQAHSRKAVTHHG